MSDPHHYPQRAFSLPPDATEIVLLRHGASAHAVRGESFPLVNGQGDPPLAPEGVEQAADAAERLAREELAAIFVTPLQRTSQTAAPVAAAHGLEPTVVPDLVEVHLGEWEGGEYRIRAHEGDPLIRRVIEEEDWALIPGAESMDDVAARARAGIEHIVATVGSGVSALAVLHGGIIGELCRQATGGRPFAFIHADNCSISRIVVFADGRWLLRSFNDISHLAAVGADDTVAVRADAAAGGPQHSA
ncbi:MAG: Phosphoglycerate mutase [uncultured Solirubrobacteraceae bacterium]|uniref:Phosphoglycerate mutase n=1 Tax=uncultured Solirubrobacteraceae bacterium TaxID=1162706 RepID=A0A6J4RWW2_9ACTN|nr:MAG: Phosphoglycerate mutase [uncultured Solirubrobacteraceae bacterium]